MFTAWVQRFRFILLVVTTLVTALIFLFFSFNNTSAFYDSEECVNHNGWLWIGPEFYTEDCGEPWQGGNYCCASNENKGNNVCNDKFRCTVSDEGWCTHGPWAWQSEVKHDCGWRGGTECGVCFRGDTQTETRFNTSCATSTCGVNTCAREVTVQEKTSTCNADCGGWSVTQDWHDVQSYPECPANNECGTSSQSGSSCYSPPGHTHTYSCVNNSCTHTDDPNGSTDPNCGGQCTPPPPPPPPPVGSCTVSWNLSNLNPPQNSNIQVRVSGLSDPGGWQNVELYRDGVTGNFCWGGFSDPFPTFNYNCVPTGTGGPHTLAFTVQPEGQGRRSCSPTQTFNTQLPPPTCSNTSPGNNQLKGCLFDGVNFNTPDGNAPDGVLLSSPVPDSPWALNQDWGTGQPNSFVGNDTFSSRWRGNLTFKQGTYIFQVGADDGVRLKVGGVEKIDIPPGTSWRDQGYTLYSAQVTFTAQTTTLVEVEYYENGGNAKVTLSWTYTPPPPPLGPWIQTTGGDVHSNTRINTPGGP